MSQEVLSVAEHQPEKLLVNAEHESVMTTLGLVEGEVLAYLDRQEVSTLRRLNRELHQPAYLVMMALGALIRAGLVRGIQHELDVVVRLRKPLGALR